MKLYQCNACGGIYEDMNPQIGAKEYPDNIQVPALQKFYPEMWNLETGYWGCPECCTDGFLQDEIDESELQKLITKSKTK